MKKAHRDFKAITTLILLQKHEQIEMVITTFVTC